MLAPERGGPSPSSATSLIDAARRIASEVLAPAADDTDQAEIVPAGHLRALADAGLMALFCPEAGADGATRWKVFETLAAACGVTFFVWVQHHAPVRLLVGSENDALRRRWLPPLCSGETLGGVAFAHLRRSGPPPVTVRAVEGGYLLEGEAPYVTSWGLAGLFAVAARLGEHRVVFVLVPADAAGLRPSSPLRLAVMAASSTVRLGFDRLFVPASDVIVDLSLGEWQAKDRVATARPNPAAFGVAAASIRLLEERDEDAAGVFEAERLECWTRSVEADPEDLERLVELRAWSLDLALRSAQALVAATGGGAMELSHPAQRLLREASFYAIQAQTSELRRATLARLRR
ncbi:MAG: acyl-CoA/acyl-ACP dehydrogenase [Actinomycetota bacterium]|nr:acyl-CoA/acyl-ACP dehydrogenase [Actinomycetota bacterium]